MKKFFTLVFILIVLSSIAAATEQAAKVADKFVLNHGKFYHKYSEIKDTKIFRKIHSENQKEISFLYLVKSIYINKEKKGEFIITINKDTLEITKLKIIRKQKPNLLL